MRANEIGTLLRVAYAQYPDKVTPNLLTLWQAALGDMDYELAQRAVAVVVCETPYPPKISDLRQAAARLSGQVNERTFDEAWALVDQASHNALYHEQEELEKLPPDVRVIADRFGLRAIALAEGEELSVVRGQFRMAWEQNAARQKARAVMPEAIRQMLEEVAARKALPSGE